MATYPQLTFQQRQELLKLLGQQPEANPTSTQFDANFFSNLMNVTHQPTTSQPVATQQTSDYVIVRTVENPSSIEVKDVTIGVKNVFPSTNGTDIYVKYWGKDGGIVTDTFVKVNPEKTDVEPVDETLRDLKKRVKRLETTVQRLKRPLRKENGQIEEEKSDG